MAGYKKISDYAALTTLVGTEKLLADTGSEYRSVAIDLIKEHIAEILSIGSGTYTPTLGGTFDSSTVYDAHYTRIGNIVSVSGKIDLDAANTSQRVFRLSLPIPSNFDDTDD